MFLNRIPPTLPKCIFALVWIANGFFCKILGMVPRHEEIVARVLGHDWAPFLTILIGFGEVLIAAWILVGVLPRWSVITQVVLVVTMNIIEFVVAPDLLLWGRLNSVFALAFVYLVYAEEFRRKKPKIIEQC